jgi:hypothetical protein
LTNGGPHAGKFSVKYKDDPGRTLFCVRVMEMTSTGFCWGSRSVIPLEVTMTVAVLYPPEPDFLFCCFIEVTMTVVKSVSDGLRDCESETQLNLNRPLRISAGPRHLSWPLTAETARMTGLRAPWSSIECIHVLTSPLGVCVCLRGVVQS